MKNKSRKNDIQYIECEDYQKLIELFDDRYTIQYLYYINRTRKFHYRKKEIAKKNGGIRKILVPDGNLKNIQRAILIKHLENIPISSYATAYHKGAKLTSNAIPHLNKKIILKMDISDFFGSISEDSVYLNAFNKNYFSQRVGKLLASLSCYKGSLVQGTPTAPAIANIIMKKFDEPIGKWCADKNIVYTRYCDDMTFSGDFSKDLVISKVTKLLNSMNLYPNEKKTIVIPKNKRQVVTGVMVNEKIQVPESYRKEIRKEIYYCKKFGVESHLEHCNINSQYTKQSYINHLCGKINYVLMINPEDREFINYRHDVKTLE